MRKEAGNKASKSNFVFLNWVGGKSKVVSRLLPLVPEHFVNYYEPFLGGASLFFALLPSEAVLGDSNEELINCYIMVRDRADEVIEELKALRRSRETYNKLRGLSPTSLSQIDRAVRFIYLNKTSYNSVYRVNEKGQFNVPFGRSTAPIYAKETLEGAAAALRGTTIVGSDFEETVSGASSGDFVYLDPPYYPTSPTANFAKYTIPRFVEQDHERLQKVFRRLDSRGCRVLLTNSSVKAIDDLYSGYFRVKLKANRYVNSNPNGRSAVEELAISNYPMYHAVSV